MTMSRVRRSTQHQSREGLWWATFGVTATLAITSLIGAFPLSDPRSKLLSSPSLPTHSDIRISPNIIATATKREITTASFPTSQPVELIIPAIGLYSSVGTLGLQSDGQVMVPTNSQSIGWYRGGVTPGQIGSAVILGHVDSYLGPGAFFNLKSLGPGDRIDVVLADGMIETFVVERVVQYSKEAFPDQLVYGSNGIRGLQLVTCGGIFDRSTGSYDSNIVVFSELTTPQL